MTEQTAPATETRPLLAMQFEQPDQQLEAATLGMWTFLATEILFFGGLFLTYTIYRIQFLHAWVIGSAHLKEWAGGINTMVLLTSSFFVALAVHAAETRNRRRLVWSLVAALILGVCFLGIKATEYYLEYREGVIPVVRFTYSGPDASHVQLFMLFYFFMTLLHATHMVVGIGLLAWLAVYSAKGRFTGTDEHPANSNPVQIIGLYWHFVDVVWLFLFPLLYLVR